MSRPLRRPLIDGWYHVINRGIDRQSIYRSDWDREHFLAILAESAERYLLELHAYVLMDNHYHLLVRTPDANLSSAMKWINQRHAQWMNRAYGRVGPLFQGRFKAVSVEEGGWLDSIGCYIHLNPVRTASLGLGKAEQAHKRARGSAPPSPEVIAARLQELRSYPWSSYRAYAGYTGIPAWLETRVLLNARPQKTPAQQRKNFRQATEQWVTEGQPEEVREGLKDGLAHGSKTFARTLKEGLPCGREHIGKRTVRTRRSWEEVVEAVQGVSGKTLADILSERGGWARGCLFLLAQRTCGLTLKEIGERSEGMDYAAVSATIRRFENKATQHQPWRTNQRQVALLLNVET